MQAQATEGKKKTTPGIEVRHSRFCPSRNGGVCNAGRKGGCAPLYLPWVYSPRDGKKLRPDHGFKALAAAKRWRNDALGQVQRGQLQEQTRETVRTVGDAWLEGAKQHQILNRQEQPYKPSVLRGYEADLKRYIYPDLGALRVSELRRRDVQALADRLRAQGLSPSKIRNALLPLRVICRELIRSDELVANPTMNLRLPKVGKGRERAATPAEAQELLAALPDGDRAVWATAFYAGLRRGELQALAAGNIDLKAQTISVWRSWDAVAGFITPKSAKGTRTVPMSSVLKPVLAEHLARTGRRGDDLLFGRTPTVPFSGVLLRRRALRAWDAENEKRAEKKLPLLVPIGLHEGRHTFVSIASAAGVPLETIGDMVGHSSVYMTDAYRHLLPDGLANAMKKFDKKVAGGRTS